MTYIRIVNSFVYLAAILDLFSRKVIGWAISKHIDAFAESFIKMLKQEEVYLAHYETYLDVLENLPSFIEEVYNEKRAHAGIDYLTPSELEERIKIDPTLISRFVLQL